MKIITDNCVYVQMNDIMFLNQTDLSIPVSIFLKVFNDDVVIIDDRNRYDFVKFDDALEIEFFRNLDFIVDYNSVKDLSEEEIIDMGEKVANKRNSIAKTYNAMTRSIREENMYLVYECERLDYKMYSLRDILWFRQGRLKFNLPSEIIGEKKEKGIKKLLRKIKKK